MSGNEADFDFDSPLMTGMDMQQEFQAADTQADSVPEAIWTPDMIANPVVRTAAVARIVGYSVLRGALEKTQDAFGKLADKGLQNIQQ